MNNSGKRKYFALMYLHNLIFLYHPVEYTCIVLLKIYNKLKYFSVIFMNLKMWSIALPVDACWTSTIASSFPRSKSLRSDTMAIMKNLEGRSPIGCASLAFVLRDIMRFTVLSPRLVQYELSLVFNPMLSLWGILVCYK